MSPGAYARLLPAGVAGLAGLDRLYSFMLVFKLQSVVNHYRARLARPAATPPRATPHTHRSAPEGSLPPSATRGHTLRRLSSHSPACPAHQESGAGDVLAAARRALGPPVGLPEGGLPGYAESLARASKAVVWGPLQEALTLVGQAQLLRRHIASELCGDANLDSYQLAVTLEACNAAVMEDIREHYRQPDSAPYPAADSALLPELSALLLATGQQNPLAQIYIMQEPLRELPVLLFFFTLAQLNRYTFDHHLVRDRRVAAGARRVATGSFSAERPHAWALSAPPGPLPPRAVVPEARPAVHKHGPGRVAPGAP